MYKVLEGLQVFYFIYKCHFLNKNKQRYMATNVFNKNGKIFS